MKQRSYPHIREDIRKKYNDSIVFANGLRNDMSHMKFRPPWKLYYNNLFFTFSCTFFGGYSKM